LIPRPWCARFARSGTCSTAAEDDGLGPAASNVVRVAVSTIRHTRYDHPSLELKRGAAFPLDGSIDWEAHRYRGFMRKTEGWRVGRDPRIGAILGVASRDDFSEKRAISALGGHCARLTVRYDQIRFDFQPPARPPGGAREIWWLGSVKDSPRILLAPTVRRRWASKNGDAGAIYRCRGRQGCGFRSGLLFGQAEWTADFSAASR